MPRHVDARESTCKPRRSPTCGPVISKRPMATTLRQRLSPHLPRHGLLPDRGCLRVSQIPLVKNRSPYRLVPQPICKCKLSF